MACQRYVPVRPQCLISRFTASSYASSRNESTPSFFSYFASTTPDSDHKRVRIKAALFLQGSTLYNVQRVKERLQQHSKLLKLELAIIEGKVSYLPPVWIVF